MEHLGMDSDPDLRRMQSPSTHFPHHIYSCVRHSAAEEIDTDVRERLGLVVYVQWGRKSNVPSKDEPGGLQLPHPLKHWATLAIHKSDCPQRSGAGTPVLRALSHAPHDVVGYENARSNVGAASAC